MHLLSHSRRVKNRTETALTVLSVQERHPENDDDMANRFENAHNKADSSCPRTGKTPKAFRQHLSFFVNELLYHEYKDDARKRLAQTSLHDCSEVLSMLVIHKEKRLLHYLI